MRYKIAVKETPFVLPISAGDLYGFCYWAGKNTDEYDTQDICSKTLAKYLYGLQAWHLYHSVEYPKESKAKVAVLLRASTDTDAEAPPRPVKAPVTITQLVALTNHLVLEMVEGNPSQIPVIRWRIPANGCGWPLFRKKLAGIRVSQRIPAAGRGDGRLEGDPDTLPVDKVQVPRRLEGDPSSH
ncbi:hypothetical protein PGTUg99_014839 [Puccinia graminis f. sp. tritici]|uniref:Uncharacterized protein n=1 Tax=Puccinia graminis f. sp. tritici TaxID=56615 RepID=A0A5B0MHI4_PUCGR|nr:hypothetical protein PGTUg99_014839 [Puccinia graminis f. sp. tritici]